jgi:ribosomal protein S6
MKRYEGLFILNNAAKEEGIKETIDAITTDITTAGGKVETVQKMDKRAFTRIADKRFTSGFYVNFIFEIAPQALPQLRTKFGLNGEIFRVLFTEAPAVVEATAK